MFVKFPLDRSRGAKPKKPVLEAMADPSEQIAQAGATIAAGIFELSSHGVHMNPQRVQWFMYLHFRV